MRWRNFVEQTLSTTVTHHSRVGGGDFAEAFRLVCADGRRVFLKTHQQPPTDFFVIEATGLEWLRAPGCINVPRVLGVSNDPHCLLMEWIELGHATHTTEAELGRGLAALHATGHSCFGRTDCKTTGSLALPNEPLETWSEFFATQRLLPLARIASERKSLPASTIEQLENVANRLDTLGVPEESPAMLHGDLWAGNRVVDSTGSSWLIDPAAHGGHREFDLAMMNVFGGFGRDCFAA
nr:fructosamine kinase family protein [Granulosicoccus sp.]